MDDPYFYYSIANNISNGYGPIFKQAINTSEKYFAFGVSYLYSIIWFLNENSIKNILLIEVFNLILIYLIIYYITYYISNIINKKNSLIFNIIIFIILMSDSRWQYAAMVANSDLISVLIMLFIMILNFKKYKSAYLSPNKLFIYSIAIALIGIFFKYYFMAILIALFINYTLCNSVRIKKILFLIGAIFLLSVFIFLTLQRGIKSYLLALFNYINSLVNNGDGYLYFLKSALSNLLFFSIPENIIPNYQYLNNSSVIPQDLTCILGFITSCICFYGMFLTFRRQFFPFLSFCLCIPIFTLVIDGTARYLMIFQAFLLASFFSAIISLKPRFSLRSLKIAAGFLVLLLIFTAYSSINKRSSGFINPFKMIEEISESNKEILNLLEIQKSNSYLLYLNKNIYSPSIFADLSNHYIYNPDNGLNDLVKSSQVFVLFACDARRCSYYDEDKYRYKEEIKKFGNFFYKPIKQSYKKHSTYELYQLIAQ